MRIQTLMWLELETLIALKNRTRALSWHQILAGSHGKGLSTNQICPWQHKPSNKQLFPIPNQLELVYSFHTEFQNTLSYYNPAQRWQIHGLLMPPKQPDFARCQTQGTALTNVSSVLFHRGETTFPWTAKRNPSPHPAFWLCLDSFTSASLDAVQAICSSPRAELLEGLWCAVSVENEGIVLCRLL